MDKYTARIIATNTLPGELVPWGTISPGDWASHGTKSLGVPNHRGFGFEAIDPETERTLQ